MSAIKRYRKKPVVIEAVRFSPNGRYPLSDVMAFTFELGANREVVFENGSPVALNIKTLEGTMRAEPGDWIIKGVKGEFYPCKPDIFAATYEEAE